MKKKISYVTKTDGSWVAFTERTVSVCVKCHHVVRLNAWGQRPNNCGHCGHSAPTDSKGGRFRAEVRNHDLQYKVMMREDTLVLAPNTADEPTVFFPGTWDTFGYTKPITKADLADAKGAA